MIFFIGLFILFTIQWIAFRKKGITYPLNYLTVGFFVYFVFKYFVYYFFGFNPLDGLSLDDFTLPGAYLFSFFFIVFFVFYFLYFSGKKIRFPQLKLTERISFRAMSYISIIGTLLILVKVGGVDIFSRPLMVRELMSTKGMFYFSTFMMYFTSFYTIKIFCNKKYKELFFFSILYLFFAIISGRASLVVAYIFTYFMVRGVFYRKPIAKYLFILAPLLAVFVIVSGFQRDMSYKSSVSWQNVSKSLYATIEDNGSMLKFILGKIVYRIDNLEGFTLLVNALDKEEIQPVYGTHMVGVLYQWIPRKFWPDKPLNFTSEMTKTFRPDVFNSGAANNFTGIGEILYNFGPAGIPLFATAIGILIFIVSQMWEAAKGSIPMTYLTLCIGVGYIGLSILAGFINDLALPVLIINMVCIFFTLKISVIRPVKNLEISPNNNYSN